MQVGHKNAIKMLKESDKLVGELAEAVVQLQANLRGAKEFAAAVMESPAVREAMRVRKDEPQ